MDAKEKHEIDRKRNYSIRKKNELVRSAKYELTMQELKFLAYIFSQISPEDTELHAYTISIHEYCQIVGIDYDNGNNYRKVKATIKKLADKSFWIFDEKTNQEILERWIDEPIIDLASNTIKVKLREYIRQYVIGVIRGFTDYSFLMILPMRSGYGIRLYELLKSYQYNARKTQTVIFDVEELKHLLFGKDDSQEWIIKYPNFKDFRNNVLMYGKAEIDKYTDIKIDWEEIYKGKKVNQIKFIIQPKSSNEVRESFKECWKQLDKNKNEVAG